MTTTTTTADTTAAIWDMLADRWRKTIKAKALSANTERGYLYTARRWSAWLASQGLAIEPAEVRAHHVDDFIADIIETTSAANGAHHYATYGSTSAGWSNGKRSRPAIR